MNRNSLVYLCSAFLVVAIVASGCNPAGQDTNGANPAVNLAAAPVFSLDAIDGTTVSSSDIIGQKSVMLIFWATWCVECRAEIPKVNALFDKFNGPTFEIIGVNVGESPEKVSKFLDKTAVKYKILLDKDGKVGRAFNVPGYPWSVLIDRTGTVRYNGPGLPKDPETAIKTVL